MKSQTITPIDAPHYRYWQALYLSFFSRSLYVDVGKRWQGVGFCYLVILFLILSIPLTVYSIAEYNLYNKRYMEPLEAIPSFIVQNGNVIFDKPMPYVIKNDLGEVIVMVDTTGKNTPETLNNSNDYPNLLQLITANRIYQRNTPVVIAGASLHTTNPWVIQTAFDKNTNMVFNGLSAEMKNKLAYFILTMKIIVYPFIVTLLSGLALGMFLISGMMAQLFSAQLLKHKLLYSQAVRLLSVASTPAFVLAMLQYSLAIHWIRSTYLILGLLAVYFIYAVMALKKSSQVLTR